MPTENINIETQVQSAITRAALQALVTASTVKKKIYHITDALAGTATIAVYSRSTNQVSYNAMNLNTGKFGMYWLAFDVFNPIVEGDSAVMSYVNNTFFPATGNYNAVYLDLSTGIAYAWNGTTYFALSGGNVYEPTEGDFPLTGATDTIYIATDTGVMYLWDGSAYVPLNNQSVQTVTGYSVDNTDPVNPIVKAIPTAGTNALEPVTGTIKYADPATVSTLVEQVETADLVFSMTNTGFGGDGFGMLNIDISTGENSQFTLHPLSAQFGNGNGGFIQFTPTQALLTVLTAGALKYSSDYSSTFVLRSLIDLAVMKSRIWTKAGTPTITDDSTQGYVVGSLIWDTTNSILYKCTSNSAGAATWVYAIKSTLIELIRTGTTIPASVTRYATEGLAGITTGLVVTICPNAIFTTFRVFITSAQSAGGSLTVKRNFYNVAGTLTDTQTLVIPAGSAAGVYTYSGATVDRTAVDGSYGIEIINAAAATSANVNAIESTYLI